MRYYTMSDRSDPENIRVDKKLTLQAVEYMTDWTAEQFDEIANMHVGEEKLYDEWLYIKRTH